MEVTTSLTTYTSPELLFQAKDDITSNGILKMGFMFCKKYCQADLDLSGLVHFESTRGILVWCYHILVYRKACLPIDQLSESFKLELWEESKNAMPECKSKKTLIECSKAIYALNELSKIQYHEFI